MIEEIKEFVVTAGSWRVTSILLILVVTIVLAKFIRSSLKAYSKTVKVDPTRYRFAGHLISAIIYIIGIAAIVRMVPPLKALSTSILAGAGLLAVILGFASQQAFANIVSGLFIIVSKPYRVGDAIRILPDLIGKVEDITLRHTVIRTYENKMIIVPNHKMNTEIVENYHIEDPRICSFLEVGISYDSDIGKAMRIMESEAEKHPEVIDARTEQEKNERKPAVNTRVIGFGDSSVNLRAYVWAKDYDSSLRVAGELRKSIKERFDKEGIEMPFPYRTIVYKKDIRKRRK